MDEEVDGGVPVDETGAEASESEPESEPGDDGPSTDESPSDAPRDDEPSSPDDAGSGGASSDESGEPASADEPESAGDDAPADDGDVAVEEALTAEEALAAERALDDEVEADESDEGAEAGEAATESGGAALETVDEPAPPEQPTPATIDGPEGDQELPLTAHIEEMMRRLGVVFVVAGVVSVAVFPFGEEIINFLWYSILPGGDVARPRLYHPLSLVITQFKVASLAGVIIALPVFVYETYLFMKPGLYPHERRYYLAAVPTSLVLALLGVLFSYFLVLPIIFTYFLHYTETVAIVAFDLAQTFNLILLLMGYMAVVFQIPLFIMLAIMMGLTTRYWLEDRRLYFWGAFVGVAFLFSPDPTGMAPFMVGATMIALFEGTLLLLRWTGN